MLVPRTSRRNASLSSRVGYVVGPSVVVRSFQGDMLYLLLYPHQADLDEPRTRRRKKMLLPSPSFNSHSKPGVWLRAKACCLTRLRSLPHSISHFLGGFFNSELCGRGSGPQCFCTKNTQRSYTRKCHRSDRLHPLLPTLCQNYLALGGKSPCEQKKAFPRSRAAGLRQGGKRTTTCPRSQQHKRDIHTADGAWMRTQLVLCCDEYLWHSQLP